MNLNRHFGEALKKYIEDRGIAINKMADRIGVTYQAYVDYFNSKNPRDVTKTKILEGLGVTIEELFEEKVEVVPLKEYQKLLEEKNQLLEEVAQYRLEKIKVLESEKLKGESPVHKTSTSY